MTETATDRSKRVFLKYFESYEWSYQISLFYKNYRDCPNFIDDGKAIRRLVRREYPHNAFLWRLCLGRVEKHYVDSPPDTPYKTIVLPYHTLFTNFQTMNEEIADTIEKKLKKPDFYFYSKKRSLSPNKLSSYAETVKTQAPFKLQKFASHLPKINRFSLINRKSVTPVWKVGMRLPEKPSKETPSNSKVHIEF